MLVFAVLAAWLASLSSEPRYAHRKLSDWLAQFQQTSGDQKEDARQAIREIGQEAVPYLLSCVRYESSRPKMMLGGFFERHGIRVVRLPRGWTEPGRIQEMGVGGFRALGDKAIGAIPDLALYLTNGPFHANAGFALAGIGPASVPALVQALSSKHQQARFGAVVALGQLEADAQPAVPALLELYQRDPQLRESIRNELQFIDESVFRDLEKVEQFASPNAAPRHR